jgi:hypothetical protein
MLPFDNKSEFQVIVDMPNGTTLEETDGDTGARRRDQKQPEGDQRTRPTPGPLRRTTSTDWCATTSYAAELERRGHSGESGRRARARLQSHEIAKQVRERILPIADPLSARGSKWQRFRPAARAGDDWSPRSTAPTWIGHRDLASRFGTRLEKTDRRRRRRLVRRGRPAEVPLRRRRGEGRAQTEFQRKTSRERCELPAKSRPACCIEDLAKRKTCR